LNKTILQIPISNITKNIFIKKMNHQIKVRTNVSIKKITKKINKFQIMRMKFLKFLKQMQMI